MLRANILLAACALGLGCGSAWAQTSCTSAVSSGSVRFDRRLAVAGTACGTASTDSQNDQVPYRRFRFRTATNTGGITITATSLQPFGSTFDPHLSVYCVFDPANPGANLLSSDDDGAGYPNARVSGLNTTGGTTYDVVVASYSTFNGGGGGRFQLQFSLPVTIVSGCCLADFDGNGTRSIDDIFVYLNTWFANDPGADINGLNGRTIDDIFIFLNLWFAGCP